jgi:adenylate cyclase
MATIIVAHGGMIDKIVGDAVHAFFNEPADLEDHPRKAVECAIALHAWAETFRRRPEVATIGFGRTRIGIESGPAVVGDVGIRAKLDYTAHGDVVNVAARLERANKELGSSICIGPVAASRCDQCLLHPLGKITIHGRDDALAVFEPRRCVAPAATGEAIVLPPVLITKFPLPRLSAATSSHLIDNRVLSGSRASPRVRAAMAVTRTLGSGSRQGADRPAQSLP